MIDRVYDDDFEPEDEYDNWSQADLDAEADRAADRYESTFG